MRNSRALPWLALSVLLLGSCDEDDDDEIVVYQAVLRQINPQLGLTAPLGNVEIVVEGDDIVHVNVDATGLDAVDHPMFLRVGSRCPGATSDLNNDGYVDVNEGLPSFGSILVALDSDLSQSTTDPGSFPVGPIISYRENVEVDDFESSLSGRTIVIHGVGSAPPATVTPLVGMSTSHSVPILCGILVEIGN
jgi:hypothetical protein